MEFEIYKRGQGKYTRLFSAFGSALIVGLGCWRLYVILAGSDANVWLQTMIPAGTFVVLCLLLYKLVNKSHLADFMISAEGELKKVSWSNRQEIAISTLVVIIVVIFLGLLLFVSDWFLEWFFTEVLRLRY